MSNATRGLPKTNTKADDVPEFYFDNRKGSYWLQLKTGQFLSLTKADIINHLRFAQVKDLDHEDGYGLSQAERELTLCQQHRTVDYAGPLAGYPAGIFTTQAGQRVLVTSEIQPIEAKKGDYPKLDKLMGELFGSQSTFVLLWLKLALESLLNGDFRPGPMLALAGPSGCGKSLFQSLVTCFLGGRVAKPYLYMTGGTAFNSHIAAAEHQAIADEQVSLDIRSRRNFGESVKDLTVNSEMSIHAKGRDISITIPTFKRVTLSVNNEPESLAILPPLNDSLLDKIALILCQRADVGADRIKTWKTLTGELPALAFELLRMRVPKSMQKNKAETDRYGMDTWHSPELLELVSEISPEARLLSLIDEVLFSKRSGEKSADFEQRCQDGFSGGAMELEKELRAGPFSFAVEKLLGFAGACGTYLARLKSKHPDRFSQTRSNGKTRWTITKP